MSDLLVGIYRYFSARKILFVLLLGVLFAGLLLLASGIRFEEDISKTIKGNSREDLTGFVVKNLAITDKIIIDVSLEDTLKPANPEALEKFGQTLVDSLNSHIDSGLIRSITFRASDSVILAMMEMVMSHLPSFLEESDYRRIDSMIQPGFVKSALEKNYKIVLSPAGMVLKKRIQADPLGISNLGLSKLKSLQAGGNFELHDGCVFSSDFSHQLIYIVPSHPSSETSRNDQLITILDNTIQNLKQHDKAAFKISYFGGSAVAVANARQIKKDIALTVLISLILIFSLVGWYFRSIRVPLLGLLPAIFGAALALATLFLFKGKISAISLGIGSVILGLIIDYSLYFVNHYRNKGNIEQAIREMSLSILICSLTTIGAFLCLTFLNSEVLQDLGWFSAISVAGAAFFTLFFLPHLFGEKLFKNQVQRKPNFIDRFAGIRFEEKKWLIAAILIIGLGSMFFAGKTEFETNMNSLSFVTPDLAKAESDLDKISNYKLKNLYLVSTGKNIEEALRNKEKLTSSIQRLINSGIVKGKTDAGFLLSSDSLQRLKIVRWNRFWSDEKRTRLRALLRDVGKTVGFRAQAFDGFYNLLDKTFKPLPALEITVRTKSLLSDWLTTTPDRTLAPTILQVGEANKDKVYEAFPANSRYILFDKQTLTSRFIENVRHDFDLLVSLSMIFVTLLLIFSLGRLGLGLLTALPMFFSWLITLGFMGLTGIRFNIFNIIVSSFIFGLGVDYSILMMRGMQQRLITGKDDMKSYKVAVILSSLTTLFGVGALFAARHPALNSIALVSVVGVVSVVVISFVFQPLIFNGVILSRTQRNTFPVTFNNMVRTFFTWGNIAAIAVALMILGTLINLLLPVRRKKKEALFHRLFCWFSKAYIAVTFVNDQKLINPTGEDFRKPAIIISNHQSLIETPAFLRLYPKIIILTTSWVYSSPIFGPIARLANFYNVDLGLDNLIGLLKEKVTEGFSVLIFPEGHRSADHRIQRFHRGAFYLAEKLQVDILPMVVFGSGDFLGRNAFWGKPNSFRMKILSRVSCDDNTFGTTYQERARSFRQFYISQYALMKSEEGTARYYRRKLALNYVLKGPVLEWYLRVKLKLENNYELYHQLMPREGAILDLGCGYGFISYMLMFTSDKRQITGVDYDERKITVAENCFSKNERINFVCADVSEFLIAPNDGFILSDVLHYLTPEKQDELLRKCLSNLRRGGVLLIREANSDLSERHKKSALTELFSTNTGFNKTPTSERILHFTSAAKINAIATEFGLNMEIVDNKKITSNNLFIIRG
ncbi:MAG: MMPL family transporter [Bacteroidetes bacterium]|nr:MMPL family transporter [Bacteroidota bacterium]